MDFLSQAASLYTPAAAWKQFRSNPAAGHSSFHTPVAKLLLLPSKVHRNTRRTAVHTRTQLYPAAVFLTVNQWVGLHLQQNDPSRCCFLSPRCLTPPPCCCPAVSLSVFVCASVSLLVCVCMRWRGFTAVRARLRRLKRRRRSAASLPACWRYVTAPSCRCQAPLPPW